MIQIIALFILIQLIALFILIQIIALFILIQIIALFILIQLKAIFHYDTTNSYFGKIQSRIYLYLNYWCVNDLQCLYAFTT
jgi:hypothetical protein